MNYHTFQLVLAAVFLFSTFMAFRGVASAVRPWLQRRRERDAAIDPARRTGTSFDALPVVPIPLTPELRAEGYHPVYINHRLFIARVVHNFPVYSKGWNPKFVQLIPTFAYYCPECGTRLSAGPEGGISVNLVCKSCRINYGCFPNSEME